MLQASEGIAAFSAIDQWLPVSGLVTRNNHPRVSYAWLVAQSAGLRLARALPYSGRRT
jgi:hypothetical protein